MKKILLLSHLLTIALGYSQDHTPLQMNGFTHDVIANGIGAAASLITADVDGVNFCFKSADWQLNSNSNLTTGLPINGIVNSLVNTTIVFNLQGYSANNSIRLSTTNNPITSVISNAVAASKIHLLVTGGSGSAILGGTITFTDNTTQAYSGVSVSDWYGGLNAAITGIGRLNTSNNVVETPTGNPRLYQATVNIEAQNQSKTISSISFSRTSGTGIINIFAATIENLGTCPSPNTATFTNVTTNTALVTITPPAVLPSNGYDYEVRTSGNPGSGAVGLVTSGNFTGSSHTIDNLPPSLTVQVYIKSNCSSEQGVWSGPFLLTTTCSVTGYFSQNFDSVAIGNQNTPNLPNCWTNFDDGNGYIYVNSTNYSTPHSLYLYNNTQTTGNLMAVSPITNNLENGNSRIRFRARGAANGNSLKIVTLENSNNTTNLIEVTNLTLTNTWEEYIVNLPSGTNDYFAFAHGYGGIFRGIYVDDVHYEPIPSCQTPTGITVTNLTTNSALLNWNAATINNENGYTYELRTSGNAGSGATGLIDSGTTDSTIFSYLFNNLITDTQYTFYIKANCSTTDESTWSNGVTFTPAYCVPTYSQGSVNWRATQFGITEVNFVDNIPTNSSSNRLNVTIPTLNAGENYTFTSTTIGWVSIGYAIDFNNDGDFNDANETLALPDYGEQYPNFTSSVSIPQNIASGTYRLRLWNRQANSSGDLGENPCGSYNYGMWFDYLVTIAEPICHEPNNILSSDITIDTGTVSWSGTVTTYEVSIVTSGTPIDLDNSNEIIGLSTSFTQLDPNTSYDAYIRSVCNTDHYSDWEMISFTTLCDVPAPTGNTTQILINDQTFNDIIINGQNIKIYNNTDHLNEINTNNTIASGVYYCTQTITCESSEHLMINIQVINRISPPVISNQYTVCGSMLLSDVTLGLVNGSSVHWYETENSTTLLDMNTVIDTNRTYYVSQSDQYSESFRSVVHFNINSVPNALTTSQYVICGNVSFNQIQLPETYTGTLHWFSNPTSPNAINPQSSVSTGTYYVAQFVNGCYSERTPVSINVMGQLPMPNANLIDICGSGTIGDLNPLGISGAQFNWYSSLNSAVPLAESFVLTNSTYYVEQVYNGCTSNRKAVSVRVNSTAAPIIANFTVCENTTYAQLPVTISQGVSYKWYSTPSSSVELPSNFFVTSGTYYVAKVTNACESNRTAVTITVTPTPSQPTGVIHQVFENNLGTIIDLTMDQPNVIWFISYLDAINGTNPLQSNMPLVNGQTYYGVISSGNCRSLPTAVTVEILLSNSTLDMTNLSIYPNPVINELNISYNEKINKVEIYSLLGQHIKYYEIEDEKTTLDLSGISTGTYLLKIYVNEKNHTLKIIKK